MSISFYALRPGERFPLNMNAEEGSPDLPNLGNANAAAVLGAMDLLDLDLGIWGGRGVPIGQFRQACLRASSQRRMDAQVQEPYEDHSPGRCAVVSFGIDAGGIEERVQRLAAWAALMQVRGATEVYWG